MSLVSYRGDHNTFLLIKLPEVYVKFSTLNNCLFCRVVSIGIHLSLISVLVEDDRRIKA